MAQQTVQGHLLITDLVNIENVYFEYCLVNQNTTSSELQDRNYFYAYFLSDDTTCVEDKIYFTRTVIDGEYIYTEVENPSGNPHQSSYYERTPNDSLENDWSTSYPTWIDGYNIWSRQVQQLEGVSELTYGMPFLDSAVNQLSYTVRNHDLSINSLEASTKHSWINEVERGDYLIGTYSASGIDGVEFVRSNCRTYGYNTLLESNAINFRYNEANLSTMGQNGINLYYSPYLVYNQTSDSSIVSDKIYYEKITVTESAVEKDFFVPVLNPTAEDLENYYELTISNIGRKGLELTKDGLSLYGLEAESPKMIELTTEGLKILNGSILMGDSIENTAAISSGSIALTQTNFSRRIGENVVTNLRFAIGDKFGIANDGTVYVSGGLFVGSGFDNVYTKNETVNRSEFSSELSNYLLADDAANQYSTKEERIVRIQTIYICSTSILTEDDLPNYWVGSTSGGIDDWTLTPPVYRGDSYHIYSAIQFQDANNNITSTGLSPGATDLSNLFINGQINQDYLDLSGLATDQELTNTTNNLFQNIDTLSNDIQTNYVATSDSQWQSLTRQIQIKPYVSEPYIRIAANPEDPNSYLNLTGRQINFVLGLQETPLQINNNGIITNDIKMVSRGSNEDEEYSFLWIVRSNGHLSLKLASNKSNES